LKPVVVSARLARDYESSYADGISEWRRIGALGKAENIVSLCARHPHASLLEIGAGEGALLSRLSELGFGEAYFALDISAKGLEALTGRSIPRLVEARVFGGYQVPYADRQFDLAVLSHVVEHLEHPRLLLAEAARVSQRLFVEVPLEDHLRLREDRALTKVGHINFYSPQTIRLLLRSCALTVVDERVTQPPRAAYAYARGRRGLLDHALKGLLLRRMPRLATRLFCYHYAALCEATAAC
jgi:hypothetical protein